MSADKKYKKVLGSLPDIPSNFGIPKEERLEFLEAQIRERKMALFRTNLELEVAKDYADKKGKDNEKFREVADEQIPNLVANIRGMEASLQTYERVMQEEEAKAQ